MHKLIDRVRREEEGAALSSNTAWLDARFPAFDCRSSFGESARVLWKGKLDA